MAFVTPDKQFAPRQIVADLKRFLHSKDSTGPGSFTISDCGYLLLMLKDNILRDGSKHFSTEIVNPPLYGLDVLSRVIIALQAVINSSADFVSNTEISQMSTRKRKAAIAEADCIEIIKLLLEKTDRGWAYFLDSSTGMDAILFSVYSPQLDSKCFSLEILLLLLKQQKGFTVLMRALTAMAARTREYLRLGIFINQLKHGIHTHKLHIQVLVVRLLNKILASAPDAAHENLIKIEASLAHFSPKSLEMMLSKHNAMLDGYDVLVEELDVWRTLTGSDWEPRKTENHGLENSFFTKQRSASSLPMGFSTFSRNLDVPKANRNVNMNNQIKSQTLAKVNRTMLSPKKDTDDIKKSGRPYKSNLKDPMSDSYDNRSYGGMRRAKSESSMLNAERTAEQMHPFVRRLKRNDMKRVEQAPLNRTHRDDKYTGSVHDLSFQERQMTAERPVSALNQPYRYPAASRASYSNDLTENRMLSTRERERPTSSQARFMDPPVFETQKPHAGFSYLFPQQPLVSNLTFKKNTPRDIGNNKNWQPAQMTVPLSYYNGNSQNKQHPIKIETTNENPHYYTVEQDTIEKDVLDALSQFDYLNDYDNKKDYYD
ncbi:unnamed protein product [Auanema sp. JU1783]|nr:unnamed protein product [Auanema sp. JU1783]